MTLLPSQQGRFALTVNGMPASPARFAWALAIVLCLGVTIFYAAGARFISGRKLADLEVQSGGALQLSGLTLSEAGPRAAQVGPIALDPSMNQVALILHVGHTRMRSMERLACAITVRDAAGQSVWEEDRVIASGRAGQTPNNSNAYSNLNTLYGTFDVARADQYTFDVRLRDSQGDRVKSVSLEVRRNTTGASPVGIGIGLALALAGFIALKRTGSGGSDAGLQRRAA